jgi:dihydrofolate reductase
MAKVIVGMTTSLDGFVNDRTGSVERLYPDLEALRKTEFLKKVIEYTGAVVMGRRAYEMANGDFTGYEFQVPIFVVTHHPHRKSRPRGRTRISPSHSCPKGPNRPCGKPRKRQAPGTSPLWVARAPLSRLFGPASRTR